MTVDETWEIGVGESRETAYNRVIMRPYGAGKGRKNARNFYFLKLTHSALVALSRRLGDGIMPSWKPFAERAGKRWKRVPSLKGEGDCRGYSMADSHR